MKIFPGASLAVQRLRLCTSSAGGSGFGEGNGTPLQCSCLESPMDRGAWWAEVHGVAKSRTQLSNFTLTFLFHALEKEMATHSSILAWRTPGTGQPGGLLPTGSHRVGHDWSDLAAAAASKGYLGIRYLSIILGNCIWMYNYLKIKNLIKNKIIFSFKNVVINI